MTAPLSYASLPPGYARTADGVPTWTPRAYPRTPPHPIGPPHTPPATALLLALAHAARVADTTAAREPDDWPRFLLALSIARRGTPWQRIELHPRTRRVKARSWHATREDALRIRSGKKSTI